MVIITAIAAPDIDRYRNANVSQSVTKISFMVKQHGMDFRMLFWNPNYKGIDDWQLAIKRNSKEKEDRMTNFKKRFIYGLCNFSAIDEEVAAWHENKEYDCKLQEFLGLTDEESSIWLQNGNADLEKAFLKDAFIADEDENDAEQAYLNYLAAWIFDCLNTGLCRKGPASFREWKRQNTSV